MGRSGFGVAAQTSKLVGRLGAAGQAVIIIQHPQLCTASR